MRDIGIIITSGIKNNINYKIHMTVYIIVTMMLVFAIVAAFAILAISPEMEKEIPDRARMELFLGIIMYVTSILFMGINLNAFAFLTMTKEKSRGNIESLLATPLSAGSIWLAKSIAVFIPGFVIGEILTFIVMIIINYMYFVPRLGFLINPWIAVSSFIAVPLIFLGLSMLSHLVGLTGKPASGNVIVQIFLPVFSSLMINLAVHNVLEINSWSFTAVNLGTAAVMAIIMVSLKNRLTKERIVLSD
jgi:ABC-2 type transport system permease protein